MSPAKSARIREYAGSLVESAGDGVRAIGAMMAADNSHDAERWRQHARARLKDVVAWLDELAPTADELPRVGALRNQGGE